MRAIVFTEYGGPEVLTLAELPDPEPGPGEITIDVEYAGVNYAEVMFRVGQIPVGLPHTPGLEATGTVRAVGEGVTHLVPGQRVTALTLAGGGYAEIATARADLALPLEGDLDGIDPAIAAAFPCNLTVAFALIEDVARIRAGESVLILAAAGGVGTSAAQVAKAAGAGAVVGAVSDPAKADAALAAGCDTVVTYESLRAERPAELKGGADIVLDAVGGTLRTEIRALLAPMGRHVIFGDAGRDDTSFAGNDLWFGSATVGGYNLGDVAGRAPELVTAGMRRAAEAVRSGEVHIPVVEFALQDAVEAHRRLGDRSSTGKFVLRVAG